MNQKGNTPQSVMRDFCNRHIGERVVLTYETNYGDIPAEWGDSKERVFRLDEAGYSAAISTILKFADGIRNIDILART